MRDGANGMDETHVDQLVDVYTMDPGGEWKMDETQYTLARQEGYLVDK